MKICFYAPDQSKFIINCHICTPKNLRQTIQSEQLVKPFNFLFTSAVVTKLTGSAIDKYIFKDLGIKNIFTGLDLTT
ncbi:hypothetical protein QTP88_020149 [Uroleucon formosanum]